jgi:hypothetical protein
MDPRRAKPRTCRAIISGFGRGHLAGRINIDVEPGAVAKARYGEEYYSLFVEAFAPGG